MKLRDLIARVDRSEKNTDDAQVEDFARLFDLYLSWDDKFGARVKKHWIYNWYCTDTYVGLAAYYMDGEPVAVSFQSGRKSDEEIEFVSKEAATKVREFIVTLLEPEEPSYPVANLDEELPDTYTVSYGEQLLTDTGRYQGQEVKVVHTYRGYDEIKQWGNVDVRLPTGDVITVELDKMEFDYKLMPEGAAAEVIPPLDSLGM